MLRPRLTPVFHEGSRPLDRRRPRRLSAGASSLSTVLCWCQCLRLKLDGDDHGDLPSGRERSIREQAVDRNNSGQDISHLVDGDGRRSVREQRDRLRLQDNVAVAPLLMGPMVHVGAAYEPMLGVTTIEPREAGTMSVTLTPVTASGPLLVTVTV